MSGPDEAELRRVSEPEIIGPFDQWRVAYEGREIPFVECVPVNGGRVWVKGPVCSIEVDLAEANRWIPLVAAAIARAMGYVGWPDEGEEFVPLPPAPRLMSLDRLAGGDASGLMGHEHDDEKPR